LRNFKRIIDQFPELLWVSLGGWGEPLMCKDLSKMVYYANGEDIGIGFHTNGTLIMENMDNIINSTFLRLGVSIDSVT